MRDIKDLENGVITAYTVENKDDQVISKLNEKPSPLAMLGEKGAS